MDSMTALTLRKAHSMEVFTDGDPSFVWGDWMAWEQACFDESRTIPPAEFKALPQETRRSYIRPHFKTASFA